MTTKEYQKKSTLSVFLSFFKPHRRLFALDMLCAFAVAAVDLLYPLVSRRALNELLPEKAYSAFFVVMGVVALAYILRSILYYVICLWGHTFGIRVEADIREALCRLDLPDWFPGWLEQVKYLFPKGHCAAFLLVDALQA